VTDLDDTRVGLHARRQELEQRIGQLRRDLMRSATPLEQDFAEQAVQRENDEVLSQLEASAQAELARIDRALAKVAQGTYGVCEACGGGIDRARLAVLPDASRCVRCAG
jgi:RNA polymerase-binding transcription factor DksA